MRKKLIQELNLIRNNYELGFITYMDFVGQVNESLKNSEFPAIFDICEVLTDKLERAKYLRDMIFASITICDSTPDDITVDESKKLMKDIDTIIKSLLAFIG